MADLYKITKNIKKATNTIVENGNIVVKLLFHIAGVFFHNLGKGSIWSFEGKCNRTNKKREAG